MMNLSVDVKVKEKPGEYGEITQLTHIVLLFLTKISPWIISQKILNFYMLFLKVFFIYVEKFETIQDFSMIFHSFQTLLGLWFL